MADEKLDVVETIYGKHYKFEVVRVPGGFLSSMSFDIYRDGKRIKWGYDSLADAVAAAKKEG